MMLLGTCHSFSGFRPAALRLSLQVSLSAFIPSCTRMLQVKRTQLPT